MGPQTTEEQEAYAEITSGMKNSTYSSCIGWVIKQRKALLRDIELPDGEFKSIQSSLDTFSPRLKQGWSVVLFFAKQVLNCSLASF